MTTVVAFEGLIRFQPELFNYITGYLAAFGAMVALARRARDGGSYHVRVSLAQTGRYNTRRQRLANSPRRGWLVTRAAGAPDV